MLTVGFVLALVSSDALDLNLISRHMLVALLIATLGAILFGGVLGALQWLVVRRRVPIPRKVWVTANIGPALLAWLLVIMPAVITAQESDNDATWPRGSSSMPSSTCCHASQATRTSSPATDLSSRST
ncbi:hypothetical protein ABZ957_20085 [Streptomyces sp. NPDC046316]|uniref:hypothetical protein n=1 Tax=Streptomyces sp. NPDC046316 TaxID=3154494 RepID=UPI0033DDA1AD